MKTDRLYFQDLPSNYNIMATPCPNQAYGVDISTCCDVYEAVVDLSIAQC